MHPLYAGRFFGTIRPVSIYRPFFPEVLLTIIYPRDPAYDSELMSPNSSGDDGGQGRKVTHTRRDDEYSHSGWMTSRIIRGISHGDRYVPLLLQIRKQNFTRRLYIEMSLIASMAATIRTCIVKYHFILCTVTHTPPPPPYKYTHTYIDKYSPV